MILYSGFSFQNYYKFECLVINALNATLCLVPSGQNEYLAKDIMITNVLE